MRDKLIEILREPIPVIGGCDVVGESRMSIVDAERYADRLLANGVVILPFEIGDLAYVIQDGGVEPARIKSQYYVSKKRKTNIFARSLDGERDWLFDLGDVDKTIFASRYDAEQALKGGTSNGKELSTIS